MLPQNRLIQERKTPKNQAQAAKMKLRWFVALSTMPLLGVVTAFGLVPESELGLDTGKVAFEEIALPKVAPAAFTENHFWRTEKLQRGDTVSELLRRLNVSDSQAGDYLRTAAEAESFRKLPVGREVQAETDATGKLVSLRYLGDNNAQVVIEPKGEGYTTKVQAAQFEKRLFVRTGEIKTSLYAATDAAGVPEGAANQLTEIFSGDIDFHHDLKRGDKFTVIYEMTYSNGELVSTGRIQAAEFINQGTAYRAIYFQGEGQAQGDYYTENGSSVRKAFLRSPIAFSRISSGFSGSRFHPVLNKWRAHKGVDFAAPVGTPVKVTSDGIVSSFGRQNGYGNVVTINHQGRYTTVYGHLSRFARLQRGQRVKQGDVIGYVGMTGITSGPHLHYEFKVDGMQRDPLRVALPNAQPVREADRQAFQSVAGTFVARIHQLRNTNLAKLD